MHEIAEHETAQGLLEYLEVVQQCTVHRRMLAKLNSKLNDKREWRSLSEILWNNASNGTGMRLEGKRR